MLHNLPEDVIEVLAALLNEEDYVMLAAVHPRILEFLVIRKKHVFFSNVFIYCVLICCFCFRVLKLTCCYSHKSFRYIELFLKNKSRCSKKALTLLDLSYCYWFDPKSLSEIASLVPESLSTLIVHGTKLRNPELCSVLKQCCHLTHLSISLDGTDSSFWDKSHVNQDSWDPGDQDPITLLESTIFSGVKDSLQRLLHLSLHGNTSSWLMFITFLW